MVDENWKYNSKTIISKKRKWKTTRI
jgi:hypothetical protein